MRMHADARVRGCVCASVHGRICAWLHAVGVSLKRQREQHDCGSTSESSNDKEASGKEARAH